MRLIFKIITETYSSESITNLLAIAVDAGGVAAWAATAYKGGGAWAASAYEGGDAGAASAFHSGYSLLRDRIQQGNRIQELWSRSHGAEHLNQYKVRKNPNKSRCI